MQQSIGFSVMKHVIDASFLRETLAAAAAKITSRTKAASCTGHRHSTDFRINRRCIYLNGQSFMQFRRKRIEAIRTIEREKQKMPVPFSEQDG